MGGRSSAGGRGRIAAKTVAPFSRTSTSIEVYQESESESNGLKEK